MHPSLQIQNTKNMSLNHTMDKSIHHNQSAEVSFLHYYEL